MKKILILILISLVLSGCIEPENKLLKGDDGSLITLYTDGTMTIRFASTGNQYSGFYVTHEKDIVITFADKFSKTLTPKGNDYLDSDGDIWHTQTQ